MILYLFFGMSRDLPTLERSIAIDALGSPSLADGNDPPSIKPPNPVFTYLLILSKGPLIDSLCRSHSVLSCEHLGPLAPFPITTSVYMLQQEELVLLTGAGPATETMCNCNEAAGQCVIK